MPAPTHVAVPAVPVRTKGMLPTHILQRHACLRGRRGCLQPTFCRACEDRGMPATHALPCLRCLRGQRDACNPRFAVPEVPAGRRGCLQPTSCRACEDREMPATHVLPRLRCLRGRRGCLQPTFCSARGACEAGEDACSPHNACGAYDDDDVCVTQEEEIKSKEKTRSRLNPTGSDFSLLLMRLVIYGACAACGDDERLSRRGRRRKRGRRIRRT